MVGAVRRHLDHLPAGRAAAVAHDRRPPRARPDRRPPAARAADGPGRASRSLFLVVALALRGPIEDAFDGSATLYWVFVGATLAYAASYFARGYLAGHQWFGLYGGLVLFESISRFCFPVAVAVGIASGQTAVALGILAAPLASLLVVPWALRAARGVSDARRRGRGAALTLRAGAGFALVGRRDPARRADAPERRGPDRRRDGERRARAASSSTRC